MKHLSRLAGLGLILLPVSALGSVVYSDRTTFEGELTASIVDDYSDAGYTAGDVFDNPTFDGFTSAGMSAVLGETSYETTGFVDNNLVAQANGNPYYCGGCNGSFLLDFTTTSIGTASGVFGVGVDYYNSGNPQYIAFVTYGDGSTENIAVPLVPFGATFDGFFGITSNLGISSIHFGLMNAGTTQSGSFAIDNLTIGSGATDVPAPGALGLLGLSLGAMGLLGRRRRTA